MTSELYHSRQALRQDRPKSLDQQLSFHQAPSHSRNTSLRSWRLPLLPCIVFTWNIVLSIALTLTPSTPTTSSIPRTIAAETTLSGYSAAVLSGDETISLPGTVSTTFESPFVSLPPFEHHVLGLHHQVHDGTFSTGTSTHSETVTASRTSGLLEGNAICLNGWTPLRRQVPPPSGSVQIPKPVESRRTTPKLGATVSTMFLTSTSSASELHIPSAPTLTRRIINLPSHDSNHHSNLQSASTSYSRLRERGFLGFRVDDRIADDEDTMTYTKSSQNTKRTDKSSALHASTRPTTTTKVNAALWNKKNLDLYSAASSRYIPAAPSTTPYSTNSLLWFPWIPTAAQMQSLSRDELEQVCSDRGVSVSVGDVTSDLEKSNMESILRQRLWDWTLEQQQKLQRRRQYEQRSWESVFPTVVVKDDAGCSAFQKQSSQSGSPTARSFVDGKAKASVKKLSTVSGQASGISSPNSLAEWARTVDLEPLLSRREKIRHGKVQRASSPKSLSTQMYQSRARNRKQINVSQLYQEVKAADQKGDLTLTKNLLLQLKDAAPEDARVYRRLSRLEATKGDVTAATAVLQEGLRLHPQNPYLWHGMAGLVTGDEEKKRCWNQAIKLDPSFPHAYHALGTLEHTQGRVANAMKVLKEGLKHSPLNHRLHHALGDLYRDAKMLVMAERCYSSSLKLGPPVSQGFAYTSLAFVAYEGGNVEKCRKWLLKAIKVNNGRQANAWLALAQMEEAVGNIEAARSVSIAGISQYERGLLERYGSKHSKLSPSVDLSIINDPVRLKNALLKAVPQYRSGDRFYNLYRNWARLEERYGTRDSVEEVYERATAAFPSEFRLHVDRAQYYVSRRQFDQARSVFNNLHTRIAPHEASPHRLYASFEMSQGNYRAARKVLYRAVATLTQSPVGVMRGQTGYADLYLTWAICEWHLGHLSRAEVLFDHALRTTKSDEESGLRSFILYSTARLHRCRGDYVLAQHFIGLCLAESLLPGGNSKVWELWADVATSLGNARLAEECTLHAEQTRSREIDSGTTFSRFLTVKDAATSASGLSRMKGQSEMESQMRRDPWHHQIVGLDRNNDYFDVVQLPDMN